MDELGKKAEDKRQQKAVIEDKAKEMQQAATKAEKQHKENKEQGMI